MYSTVDDYLADKDPAAVDAFRKFRALVLALGDDVEETVHTSEISWARASSSTPRGFAAAFLYATRLEVALDLSRRVHHPTLREAYPTTGRVTTHRLSLSSADDLDDGFCALLTEAYNTASMTAG
ncbi:DUF5655 domain-containing protein [Rhodococcus artemisiae]|uniref:DUF5655 domain-containing protein n=1 Tax=Rhodococcus artemisiae TaxID=714159 RepID=A0ABU7L936_9NOCA|nr:DUF5655 domain-containing protein [Rhodococcus artemisiae]MEE2057809.1 DUF5655 domain-containing protein [Rhodococcus artemisiae]